MALDLREKIVEIMGIIVYYKSIFIRFILAFFCRMYFDQKYQQRLAAQEEFEKEVEANIDNRIHSTEADTDYDGVDNTVEIDTYTYEDYSGSDR